MMSILERILQIANDSSLVNSTSLINVEEPISISGPSISNNFEEAVQASINATPQEAERILSEEISTPNQDDLSPDLEISPSLESLQDDSLNSYIDPCTDQTLYRPLPHTAKWTKAHPVNQILGNPSSSVRTRSVTANECLFTSFLSNVEPMKVSEALIDPD